MGRIHLFSPYGLIVAACLICTSRAVAQLKEGARRSGDVGPLSISTTGINPYDDWDAIDGDDAEWSDAGFLELGEMSLDDMSESHPAEPAHENHAESDAGANDDAKLSQQLANPVANLISIPLQSNFNFGGGFNIPGGHRPRPLRMLHSALGRRGPHGIFRREFNRRLDFGRPLRMIQTVDRLHRLFSRGDDRDQAFKYLMNFQPVVPITLSPDWNLISRTIVPIIAQNDVIGSTSQGGLGDTTQSLFFSPTSTEPFIWGVGPVFLLPTSTDHNLLGSYRWGMGPTGVILKEFGPLTVGTLANHIWSFSRDDGRKEVNSTFIQPFVNYTFKTATSITLNTESSYDWIDNQWNVPIFAGVGQLVKIGKLPVNFQIGGQYWVEGPDSAPDWSTRFQITFLFPKG